MAEVEYTNWFSRMTKSCGSAVVGVILFLVAFPLLIWNEGRAVDRAKSLAEGSAACISVAADKVDDANDGKLIHVTGEAAAADTVTDPVFNVTATAKALKLVRTVEIYQWVETTETKKKKNLVGGGETTTTYYYHKKQWTHAPVDSSHFKPDDGDQKGKTLTNVGTLTYPDATEWAKEAKLGAFRLTKDQVNRIGSGDKLLVTSEMADALPAELKGEVKVTGGYFYRPFNKESDGSGEQIGDLRISFTELKPQAISVIAGQFKGSFEPWKPPSGGSPLDELETGTKSKEAMIQAAEAANAAMTWILRGVGFLLMFIGIMVVLYPLQVFAEVLPLLGSLVGAGIFFIALVVALPLSLITIAVSWVAYRPLIGIPILALGLILLLGGGIFTIARIRAAKSAAKPRDAKS